MSWRQLAQKWLRRAKYGAGALLYCVFNLVVLLRMRAQPIPERVAIVFPDYLGDVLMWLPYGQALANRLIEERQQVYLVCDAAYETLFQHAFPMCEIVGIKSSHVYLAKPVKRAQLLLRLRRLRVARSFYMSHPRGPINRGESFVSALGAPAIGFDRVFADRPMWEVQWSNRHYATLVPTDKRIVYHVQRHFAKFLRVSGYGDTCFTPAWLPLPTEPPMTSIYWILAPGASRAFRQWPAERFAAVAAHVASARPDWRCVIVGTASERPLAQAIAQRLGDAAINLAGQTDVMALIGWIAHARLVLGNDSAAGHIAAATGTPAVVVVGGGHWGRCYPYDPEASPVHRLPVAVGYPMPCFGCDWYCVHTTRTDQPFPCIDGVTVETVIQAVDAVLGGRTSAGTVSTDPPALEAGAQRQQAARSP